VAEVIRTIGFVGAKSTSAVTGIEVQWMVDPHGQQVTSRSGRRGKLEVKEVRMEIGTEEPLITIEPLEEPVPGERESAPEPDPEPVEVPEQEPVPA
jgi:hypothetical protein